MNIAKAMKVKNQLAGEISKLKELIIRENVQVNANKSRFHVKTLYAEYAKKVEELVALKTRIARANHEIWGDVFMIVELKGQIQVLKSMPIREGTFRERDYTQTVENTYVPAVNAQDVEAEVTRLEKRIVDLQDKVDSFNHLHEV